MADGHAGASPPYRKPTVNTTKLEAIAQSLMAAGKGLLAMDESNPTCDRRFAELDIPQTKEMRRQYRRLIASTPGLSHSISGAILYDETIHETLEGGEPFADGLAKSGIVPGIKVDIGAKDMPGFPGEKVTEGLDGLIDRVQRYARIGAKFAKWRAVIGIGDGIPSDGCIAANAHALGRYAAICQMEGLVPIVEPEVLTDGSHDIERCAEVTERVLRAVFNELASQRVMLEGMILKPNMVLPGKNSAQQYDVNEVADATVKTLLRAAPAAVAGIAFLSGGQPSVLASARLNAMNVRFGSKAPWPLTFSFSRAIQQEALAKWAGLQANVDAAQNILLHRANCNSAARLGKYDVKLEERLDLIGDPLASKAQGL